MDHRSPLALPSWDLQRCFDIVGTPRWQRLAGQRVFITGGTGFVGKWLLGTLIHANEILDLGCQITVLSRNPADFLRDWPLIPQQISWLAGDLCHLDPGSYQYDVIIHAATDVARQLPNEELFFSIVEGTRRIVEVARHGQATRLLLLSSGAVYGQLPADMQQVPETYAGAPSPLLAHSAYGEGKRVAEWLVAQAAASGNLICRIARLFCAVGPHYPINKHFAVGNFIADALANKPIIVKGDGTAIRSYLYAADMAGWLWAMTLSNDVSRIDYNIGSYDGITISDLAVLVAKSFTSVSKVNNLREAQAKSMGSNRYVPDVGSITGDLRLPPPIPLEESIYRTIKWYKEHLNGKNASHSNHC